MLHGTGCTRMSLLHSHDLQAASSHAAAQGPPPVMCHLQNFLRRTVTQYLPRTAWPALYLPLMLALLQLAWPPLWQAPQCHRETGRVRMPILQVAAFDMLNLSFLSCIMQQLSAAFVLEL